MTRNIQSCFGARGLLLAAVALSGCSSSYDGTEAEGSNSVRASFGDSID